ncbi:efflux RND transporter periplasmic adaptor subunit [Paracnuella aquatica]|uniref:efflux RND transporter periplasmic adaptor subunit n=1 Tax=Paracnuella aquatica TaxID=2268757 RepID=UPI000DF0024E|nr:efflux RND transporter periplasmic adaptor subunit [Paracnuella aquatica]RPD43508.1 HlyD family efflux transporter periplasmic adaptor subunit [Paracnuella aquatica]
MKKNFIASLGLLVLAGSLVLAGCDNLEGQKNDTAHKHEQVQQYTCPMHPQVVKDSPGKCPLCGMDLVPKQNSSHGAAIDSSLLHLLKPVNEQVVAATPIIQPESGTRIHSVEVQGAITYDTRRNSSIASRVNGRIERLLVKYNYQSVSKGQLIMEVYSPDLAAAQRELVFISQRAGSPDLLEKAKQRLLLLGMQPGQIQQVLKTGKILYRVPVYSPVSGYILERTAAAVPVPSTPAAAVSAGGDGMGGMSAGGSTSSGTSASTSNSVQATPVLLREGQYVNAGQSLFNVYSNTALVAEFSFNPALAAQIKRGQKLVFRKTANPEDVYTGKIGLVQPTFREGNNFTLARVYLNDARFQVGQLLTANIPIVNRGWWLPQSAVLQVGSQSVVFKKEGDVFVPRTVQTGLAVQGMVQIEDSVGGWNIAKSAAYLVDSESFIKLNSTNQEP